MGSIPVFPLPRARALTGAVDAETGSPVMAAPEPGALRPVGIPG